MRPHDSRRSEKPDTGAMDVLWPASSAHRPAARTAAHVPAGLVVEFALLLAYASYFWDRFEPGRPTGRVDVTGRGKSNGDLSAGASRARMLDRSSSRNSRSRPRASGTGQARKRARSTSSGTRATVVCAYAACAGPEAVAALEPLLGSIDDVRADCERCALLAGLITAAPADTRHHDRARAVLDALLAGRFGQLESGAAMSLLKALDQAGASGFADLARHVLTRAKDDSGTDRGLLAWLTEAAPRMSRGGHGRPVAFAGPIRSGEGGAAVAGSAA